MKMVLNHCFCLFLFLLLTGFAYSSTYISYDAFESHGTGRTLLQQKTKCSEDFEKKNYTIITSQCKGPNYQPTGCCNGLKEFACPFKDLINNETTDCASTMFSYINIYGKYPPGLFANTCKEGKEGLDCDKVKSSARIAYNRSTILLMLTASFLVLLFQLF